MNRSTNVYPGEAPYLTHVSSHHGQLTLIPPDNAGRVRKMSPGRSTRNPNFYSSTSSLPSTGRSRSPRLAVPAIRRPVPPLQQPNLSVPDSPPPSFQEAISSPIYGIPAQASWSVNSFSTYHSIAPRSPSELSYPTTSASADDSIYEDAYDYGIIDDDVSPSDSDSGGLEITSLGTSRVEWEEDRRQGLSLDDRVRREAERREFARTLSRQRTCSHCGASGRDVFDSDESSILAIPSTSPKSDERDDFSRDTPVPANRRRFLLKHKPSRSMGSASVPSTPISTRDRPSFRSCPSSASQQRRSRSMSPAPRPLSPSSAISRKQSLSFMSKKLFTSSKGKERSASEEPLESWEVLESTTGGSCQYTEQPQVSRLRKTLSKMNLATIGGLSSTLDPPRAPTVDPYLMQHTCMSNIPSEKHGHQPLAQNLPVPPIPPVLQDRTVRSPPQAPPSLRKHSPLATNVYSPFSFPPSSSASPTSTEPGFSKRSSRPPPPISRNGAVQRGTRPRYQSMSIPSIPSTVSFPPLSPTHQDKGNMSLLEAFPNANHDQSPSSEPTGTDEAEKVQSNSSSLLTIRPLVRGAPSDSSRPSSRSPTSPVSSQSSSPSLRLGHHYFGRPLPIPPVLASPAGATSLAGSSTPCGDEKAAIRFADAQHKVAITSRAIEFPRVPPSPSSLSETTSRSSVTEIDRDRGQNDDSEIINSEITELDILVSRIDDSNQGGNYEDLLLVSEILGQGNRSLTDHIQREEHPENSRNEVDVTPIVGRIEVERRRVLKNGRVKVKLSLLGIGVDKCGVCLSQFKDNELAALGPKCQHSYHEHCLKMWLRRNHVCPLCRGTLELERA